MDWKIHNLGIDKSNTLMQTIAEHQKHKSELDWTASQQPKWTLEEDKETNKVGN